MPREFAPGVGPATNFMELDTWMRKYFDPKDWSTQYSAVFKPKQELKKNGETTFVLDRIVDAFTDTHADDGESIVIILGLPTAVNSRTTWVTMHQGELYHTGNGREVRKIPTWRVAADGYYRCFCDMLHQASLEGTAADMRVLCVRVACAVLRLIRWWTPNVPELLVFANEIMDVPRASDTMQRSLAWIVLGKPPKVQELENMLLTALERNIKHGGSLRGMLAMCVLLPGVYRNFVKLDKESRVCAYVVIEVFESVSQKLRPGAEVGSDVWLDNVHLLYKSWGMPDESWDRFSCTLKDKLNPSCRVQAGPRMVALAAPPRQDSVRGICKVKPDLTVIKVNGTNSVRFMPQNVYFAGFSWFTMTKGMEKGRVYDVECRKLGRDPHLSFSSSPGRRDKRYEITKLDRPVTVVMGVDGEWFIKSADRSGEVVIYGDLNVQMRGVMVELRQRNMVNNNAHAAKLSDACAICLGDGCSQPFEILSGCKHGFHIHCLDAWKKTCEMPTCPICRTALRG